MKWQGVGERGKRRDTKRRGREKGEETLEKGERAREKRRDCHRAQGREARCARRSVRSFVGAAVRVGREGASGYCAPPPSSFLLLRPSVRLCLRPLLPSPSSSSPSSEASPPSSSYRRRSFSSPPLSFFRFLSSSFLPYSRRNT